MLKALQNRFWGLEVCAQEHRSIGKGPIARADWCADDHLDLFGEYLTLNKRRKELGKSIIELDTNYFDEKCTSFTRSGAEWSHSEFACTNITPKLLKK